MRQKVFEIVDRATCIKVLITELRSDNYIERSYLGNSGFDQLGANTQYLMTLLSDNSGMSEYDPYKWIDSYTIGTAHKFFYKDHNFHNLLNGWTIDCEYIRGETDKVKLPEIIELSPIDNISFEINDSYSKEDVVSVLESCSIDYSMSNYNTDIIEDDIIINKKDLRNISGDQVYSILKYFKSFIMI